MNLNGILSLVASVATILLIFFKVKSPRVISLQVFLGLLIIVCVTILAICYVIDRNDEVSDQPAATGPVVDTAYPVKGDKDPEEQYGY